MRPVVAIDGLRGTGKSTLVEQFQDEFGTGIVRFPSLKLKDPKRVESVNWKDYNSIVKYNMDFFYDFVDANLKRHHFNGDKDSLPVICDRYILSNLAHFRFDVSENGFPEHWDILSKVLYQLYNSGLVIKPIIQIYLEGRFNQPTPKFDDSKYKNQSDALKYYYDLEIDNMTKYMGIKVIRVKSFHSGNDAFGEIKELIKNLL